MVFRMILRYLANNQQLVDRLAASYPIRRAAQLAVSVFYRGKALADEHNLKQLTPERFKSLMAAFRTNLKQEIEAAKEEMKKRKP